MEKPARQFSTIDSNSAGSLAVLVSGGLDSAVLLGESLACRTAVYPLYVRSGHWWEPVELHCLQRFLEALDSPVLHALHCLELPVADLYGEHWSVIGQAIPDASSADEAVFLPGRNVLLLAKAMLWCHLRNVSAVALATLASNPFPDATPAFFAAYQNIVNQAIGGKVKVELPYAQLSKTEVLHRGKDLPLGLTFSCIAPVGKLHCGRCNKCAERRRAFTAAGLVDPTLYSAEAPCTA